MSMTLNRDITANFPSSSKNLITVPKGTPVKFIPNAGDCSGYAIADDKALIVAGAWEHDIAHYYFYVPKDAIAGLIADAVLLRKPIAKKSDNWQETAYHWQVNINGQKFDYFTGAGLVDKHGNPKKPLLDDVLHALVGDSDACTMSFEDWCNNFGYNNDSIKAFETYGACQRNATKLRKAGINIEKERERLANY